MVRYVTLLFWHPLAERIGIYQRGKSFDFNYLSTYFQVCQGNEIRCWVTTVTMSADEVQRSFAGASPKDTLNLLVARKV